MAEYSSAGIAIPPIWHGVCFSYNPSTSDRISTFQCDHGEVGCNVQFSENSALDKIQMHKHMEYRCFHHAETCTMPLHTPRLVSDFSQKKEQLNGTLRKLSAKICSKSKRLKDIDKKIRIELKKNIFNVKLKSTPDFLHKYLKKLQKTKSSLNFLEDRLNYTGGNIRSVSIPNSEHNWILMMDGGNVNSVVLHSLKQVEERHCQFEFDPTPVISHRLNGGYGFQLSTVNINDKLMCCVRQASKSHFLALINQNDEIQLRTLETLKDKTVTDIKPSPYLECEFVYATNSGKIGIHNTLYRSDLVKEDIRNSCYSGWMGCNFGAHPRCVVGFHQDAVYLWDARASCKQSYLQLLRLPSALLFDEDKVFTSFKRPCNTFQHLVATTNSLILIDERYTSQMVFKWSHLLPSPPIYYDIQDITENNKREEVILLGSYDSQGLAMIHTQNCNDEHLPISNCPVLHLSTPEDIPNYLQALCIRVSDKVKSRLQVPLIGVCSLVPKTEVLQNPRITLLQKTVVGDLFCQDIFRTDEVMKEKSCKYGPGCSKTQMDSKSIEKLKEWVSDADKILMKTKEKKFKPEMLVDGQALINVIKVNSPHQHDCSFCCNCSQLKQSEVTMSNLVCPTCGIPSQDSDVMKSNFTEGLLLAGSSKPIDDPICDGFQHYLDPSKFKDSLSQKLYSVWTDTEKLNDAPVESSKDSFHLDIFSSQNTSNEFSNYTRISEFRDSLSCTDEQKNLDISSNSKFASNISENSGSDDLFSISKPINCTSAEPSSPVGKRISFLKHQQNVFGF